MLGNTHWVQDSFLKLNEAGPLSEIRQPLASLFQMMRNLAVDAYRRAALEGRMFVGEEDGMAVPASSGTPESLTVSRQALRIVADALATLPARTRRSARCRQHYGCHGRHAGRA